MGTSWILLCKRQLRYLGKNDLECKYFHISNCILTMKGCTVKKIILRCFFTTDLLCLHEKFQVSQSSPSRFWLKNAIFYHICGENIFPAKCLQFYTSQKKLIRFGSKLSKNYAITFKKISTPNCNGGLHSAMWQCKWLKLVGKL